MTTEHISKVEPTLEKNPKVTDADMKDPEDTNVEG